MTNRCGTELSSPKLFTQNDIDRLVSANVAATLADARDAGAQAAQIIVTSLGNMESGDATGVELDRAMKAALAITKRIEAIPHDPTSLNRLLAEARLEVCNFWTNHGSASLSRAERDYYNDAQKAVEDLK